MAQAWCSCSLFLGLLSWLHFFLRPECSKGPSLFSLIPLRSCLVSQLKYQFSMIPKFMSITLPCLPHLYIQLLTRPVYSDGSSASQSWPCPELMWIFSQSCFLFNSITNWQGETSVLLLCFSFALTLLPYPWCFWSPMSFPPPSHSTWHHWVSYNLTQSWHCLLGDSIRPHGLKNQPHNTAPAPL